VPEKRHFLISYKNIIKNIFNLEGSEAHHAINVTRVTKGDNIYLIDKTGFSYKAIVDIITDSSIKGTILESNENYNESLIKIHLGIALLKGSKLDLIVEKCTELGVHSITPLITDHSIKNKINPKRLLKKAEVSIKQCGRGFLPKINNIINLENWFDSLDTSLNIILHQSNNTESLISILINNNAQDISLIIGPEGGFSKKELMDFDNRKVKFANLGPRRLKAETAAIISTGLVDQFFFK